MNCRLQHLGSEIRVPEKAAGGAWVDMLLSSDSVHYIRIRSMGAKEIS
jgi:hypothetical protein